MNTRATEFADKWLKKHVDDVPAGPVFAGELADRLVEDAAKAGISAEEMEGDVGSVFELVYAALEYKRVESEG